MVRLQPVAMPLLNHSLGGGQHRTRLFQRCSPLFPVVPVLCAMFSTACPAHELANVMIGWPVARRVSGTCAHPCRSWGARARTQPRHMPARTRSGLAERGMPNGVPHAH